MEIIGNAVLRARDTSARAVIAWAGPSAHGAMRRAVKRLSAALRAVEWAHDG